MWRHFDSGVLFEVGGSCWLADTTGPGLQTVYHPGIALRAVSYPYIEPTTILVLKIRRVKVHHPLNAIFYMIILF